MISVRSVCVLSLLGFLLVPAGVHAQLAPPPPERSHADSLPATIPIFPLADVMLFPGVSRPLFIFEPRYRAMVRDAREGNGIIGMVLLQPGFEDQYQGRPPVHAIGCAGVISFIEELPSGEFNIVLDGLVKFRITGEDDSKPYRLAQVEAIPEAADAAQEILIHGQRQRLEELVIAVLTSLGAPDAERGFPPETPDEYVINAVAQHIDIEPFERQDLLERDGLVARSQAIIDMLEQGMVVR